jgi:nucleoside-diphosphate-sugar epimerase
VIIKSARFYSPLEPHVYRLDTASSYSILRERVNPRMNILVTGATGFIGRHLVGALSKTYSVRCLARKSSDITPLKDLNVEVAYGDLLLKESLGPALDGIDLVYHLAGEVYSRKKSDYYKGNVLATQNLLEACKEKGIKRIIFLSSVGVYKPTTKETLLTEESECEPLTIYGKTKLEAERLIKKSNIPWIIIRAPVIFGPSQPPVLNKFFSDALNKQKMFVIGEGNNLRSLCYIENLIEGLMLLPRKQDIEARTFLFSDDVPYTFNEIIKTMSTVTNGKIRVVHLPNILGDISWRLHNFMVNVFHLYFVELYSVKTMQINLGCDISKAKTDLGYNPTVGLELGIKRTAEWVRNNLSNY